MPFKAEQVAGPDWQVKPAALQRLKASVSQLRSLGLAVIVDLHPNDTFRSELFTTVSGRQRFLKLWRDIALIFRGADDQVYFELLNEPGNYNNWWTIQGEAIQEVRRVDATRPILAEAEGTSRIKALIAHKPYPFSAVSYAFHFYDPMSFTHQGANFGSRRYLKYRGTPYPVPAGVSGDGQVWNRNTILSALSDVKIWAVRNHVAVICDEFGVYAGGGVSPSSRQAYLTDVRQALEKKAIPWSVWQLTGGFGIERNAVVDRGVVRALGLNDNAQR